MIDEKLRQILEFAIAREREAASFYKRMQGKVKNDASISMLRELEEMELEHAEILVGFTNEGLEDYAPPKVADLKISDFIVQSPQTEDMTFQDVLVNAIKREDASNKLYLALAGQSDVAGTKNLFLKLATEEAKHKLQLETLYDDEILVEN